MEDFLDSLKYDFSELLESISDFFETFFNDVMNAEMNGLIMYLWSCIPGFIRIFIVTVVICGAVVSMIGFLRNGK